MGFSQSHKNIGILSMLPLMLRFFIEKRTRSLGLYFSWYTLRLCPEMFPSAFTSTGRTSIPSWMRNLPLPYCRKCSNSVMKALCKQRTKHKVLCCRRCEESFFCCKDQAFFLLSLCDLNIFCKKFVKLIQICIFAMWKNEQSQTLE